MAGDRPRAWFPDELVHAGRENFDADHVARYDAKEDADAEREVDLLRRAGLTAASRVVELGPGTGQFTVRVAAACTRVTAVDVSPVMLRALSAKVREMGLGNVDVVQAGFLSYVHEGDRLVAGQRYGFIRFGSRVDVYLPTTARPKVAIGDKVKATSTVLAEL